MQKRSKYFMFIAAAVLIGILVILIAGTAKKQPKDIGEQLKLGDKYLSELQYEKAYVAFQQVIEIEPRNVRAYVGMAEAAIGKQDKEDAVKVLEEGWDAVKDYTEGEDLKLLEELIVKLVELYQENLWYEQAIGVLNSALQVLDSGRLRELLEQCLEQTQQTEAVITELETETTEEFQESDPETEPVSEITKEAETVTREAITEVPEEPETEPVTETIPETELITIPSQEETAASSEPEEESNSSEVAGSEEVTEEPTEEASESEVTEAEDITQTFSSKKIFDYSELLTRPQKKELETLMADTAENVKADVIMLSEESGKIDSAYLEEFIANYVYDEESDKQDCVLLILYSDTRQCEVKGFGGVKSRIPSAELTKMAEAIRQEAANGRYYEAVRKFVDQIEGRLQ